MKHTIFLLTMLLVGMLQVAMAQEGPGRSLTVSELVNAGRSLACLLYTSDAADE